MKMRDSCLSGVVRMSSGRDTSFQLSSAHQSHVNQADNFDTVRLCGRMAEYLRGIGMYANGKVFLQPQPQREKEIAAALGRCGTFDWSVSRSLVSERASGGSPFDMPVRVCVLIATFP